MITFQYNKKSKNFDRTDYITHIFILKNRLKHNRLSRFNLALVSEKELGKIGNLGQKTAYLSQHDHYTAITH